MKDKRRQPAANPPSDRLHKVMATAGLGSRRALEKHIAAGEVTVDGKVAGLGQSVSAGSVIGFADRRWRVADQAARHRTLLYNKPEGEVTSRADPDGRPTVFDRLPPVRDARWVAIGRLDINTTGLLILTTDGELANTMMHPSSSVDREYACRIRGQASAEQLERLRQGVELDDGPARFSDIQEAGGSGQNHWYHVTLMEGRNREVRRLWESQGLTVSRLKRVRYGAALLPRRLRMGQWSEITLREHAILREDVGLPAAVEMLALQEIRPSHGSRKTAGQAAARAVERPGKRPGKRAAKRPARRPGKRDTGQHDTARRDSTGRDSTGRDTTKRATARRDTGKRTGGQRAVRKRDSR
jgi:23S rRNA pseudouridine2605 synthase